MLPKLEIKPFDGNPVDWYSFRDMFESLVHKDYNIPTVQKFHLLRNALQGDVANIINTLNASEENYVVAWDLLNQRCNKPRQIVQTHLKLLMELPEITRESPTSIRSLKENAQMHVNALKALNLPVDTWDAILIYIICQKLDKNTRRVWERSLENEQMPTFKELIEFLNKQERGDDFEVINTNLIKQQAKPKYETKTNNGTRASRHGHTFVGMQQAANCTYCGGNHNIYSCEEFLKLKPQNRANEARNKKLCMNCLKNNHFTKQCFASNCKKCNKKHNSLLHFEENNKVNDQLEQTEKASVGLAAMNHSEVLLGTALIKILDKDSREHDCRVLLDSCSQTNFISERLANKLNLNKKEVNLPFSGLGQLMTKAQYMIKTKIRSRNNNYESNLTFIVLPTITGQLPMRQIDKALIKVPRNICLADPQFDKPGEIDALIGNTLFYKLLSIGQIKLCNNAIILQKNITRVDNYGRSEKCKSEFECAIKLFNNNIRKSSKSFLGIGRNSKKSAFI